MIFPTDVLVILGILAVGTLFTFFMGKSKGVSVVLSLFGAIILFQNFPFMKQATVLKGALPEALNVVGIFLAFALCIFFLLDKYVVGDFSESNFFKSVFVGVAFTALILAIIYFVLPFAPIYDFGPNIDKWFQGNFTLFWWLVGPLAIVFFV
jgi:hypothetical protein